MYAIKLTAVLWLEALQANGTQALGTHTAAGALKFGTRAEAERFIAEHAVCISAGARVVRA